MHKKELIIAQAGLPSGQVQLNSGNCFLGQNKQKDHKGGLNNSVSLGHKAYSEKSGCVQSRVLIMEGGGD